jgi:HPt (histidine-containing phosphotransfer) domain-containing protein
MNVKQRVGETAGAVFWTDAIPSVSLFKLREALTASGLAPEIARDLAKRYCFIRAKNKLRSEGLIDQLSETDERLTFQMADRFYSTQAIRYTKRALLWFDKETHVIGCEDEDLRSRVQVAFENAAETYTPDRVGELIKRIFRQHKAVVPLRKNGGIYFVPAAMKDVLDQVSQFIKRIGGEIYTSPVGFDMEEVKTKALAMLMDSMKSELQAITDEVKAGGMTKEKAGNRWQKLIKEVQRAASFASSLKVNAMQLIDAASTAEISLSVVASTDSLDVACAIAQGRTPGSVLAELASHLSAGEDLPTMDDARVRKAVQAIGQAVPDIEADQSESTIELPPMGISTVHSVPDISGDKPGIPPADFNKLLNQIGA